MKIVKYIKISNDKYKIILENKETITLYEDVILKYELLLKKEITNIEEIFKYNQKYALYEKCLSYINKKIRSEQEIRTYLKKYTTNYDDIEDIIIKLKENNFLNSSLYIKSYIHDKIYLSFDGPLKIKNDLLNLGFFEDDILLELEIFDDNLIKDRITKYINKQLKVNKKSIYVFKNKMLLNLINLGYLREDIIKYLNNINFNDNDLKEKEYEKLKKKYSKKYKGLELEQIIKRKLYEKGFQ